MLRLRRLPERGAAAGALAPWLFAGVLPGLRDQGPDLPVPHLAARRARRGAHRRVSVILASILLKMGTYGFLRFAVPFFPEVALCPGCHDDRGHGAL